MQQNTDKILYNHLTPNRNIIGFNFHFKPCAFKINKLFEDMVASNMKPNKSDKWNIFIISSFKLTLKFTDSWVSVCGVFHNCSHCWFLDLVIYNGLFWWGFVLLWWLWGWSEFHTYIRIGRSSWKLFAERNTCQLINH